MYATISKRFEFSSSHRCWRNDWSEEQNRKHYDAESLGKLGHGHNYVAFFSFHGPIDAATGMILNISVIKERIKRLLDERYDHKYLNLDTPPFDQIPPTVENLARELFREAGSLFAHESASLVACYLHESPYSAAVAYADGRVEKHISFSFSAARRTWSPKLSDSENKDLFGAAASPMGHGHQYRVRITLGGNLDEATGTHLPYSEVNAAIARLHSELDHTNLTEQLPEFKTQPNTTESLAAIIFNRLQVNVPVVRVKVREHDNFFIEFTEGSRFTMGVTNHFFAAHRLNTDRLDPDENRELYGKCNNPAGHGHEYIVECTVDGTLDEASGTLCPLPELEQRLQDMVADWRYKHLDAEIEYFGDHPSTGENIVRGLWEKGKVALGREPARLRVWETPNNRFTIRRETP